METSPKQRGHDSIVYRAEYASLGITYTNLLIVV